MGARFMVFVAVAAAATLLAGCAGRTSSRLIEPDYRHPATSTVGVPAATPARLFFDPVRHASPPSVVADAATPAPTP